MKQEKENCKMKKGLRIAVLVCLVMGLMKGAADVEEPFMLQCFTEMVIPDSVLLL